MIEWIPVAVNEKPLPRGKQLLPEYSATVIGSSVVLRWFCAVCFGSGGKSVGRSEPGGFSV
jgi:hypothetical protein